MTNIEWLLEKYPAVKGTALTTPEILQRGNGIITLLREVERKCYFCRQGKKVACKGDILALDLEASLFYGKFIIGSDICSKLASQVVQLEWLTKCNFLPELAGKIAYTLNTGYCSECILSTMLDFGIPAGMFQTGGKMFLNPLSVTSAGEILPSPHSPSGVSSKKLVVDKIQRNECVTLDSPGKLHTSPLRGDVCKELIENLYFTLTQKNTQNPCILSTTDFPISTEIPESSPETAVLSKERKKEAKKERNLTALENTNTERKAVSINTARACPRAHARARPLPLVFSKELLGLTTLSNPVEIAHWLGSLSWAHQIPAGYYDVLGWFTHNGEFSLEEFAEQLDRVRLLTVVNLRQWQPTTVGKVVASFLTRFLATGGKILAILDAEVEDIHPLLSPVVQELAVSPSILLCTLQEKTL